MKTACEEKNSAKASSDPGQKRGSPAYKSERKAAADKNVGTVPSGSMQSLWKPSPSKL